MAEQKNSKLGQGRAGQSYEVVVDGCCHNSTFWIYKHPHNGSLTIESGTEEADFRTLWGLSLVSLFTQRFM
jgi:hypothetical protein